MADMKPHHKKATFCASRPKYREAKWERAVKVYTINLESRYLLVQGVPALGITKDLLEMFAIYGVIDEYRIMDDYHAEEFTNVYWIKFKHIMAARKAKKKLDNRSFFGGVLHVSYAPEFETFEEAKEKLMERKYLVKRKLKCVEKKTGGENPKQQNPQRKLLQQQTNAPQPRQPFQGQQSIAAKLTSQVSRLEKTQDIKPWVSSTEVHDNNTYCQVPARLPPLPVLAYPSQIPTASLTWNPHVATKMPQDNGLLMPTVTNHHILSSRESTLNTIAGERVKNAKESFSQTSVHHPGTSVTLDSTPTLTGNFSMDKTVLFIREKLNQIKNPHSESDTSTIEQNPKRTLDSEVVKKEVTKKQRKRI